MTYRDESEGLRVRVAELDDELARTRAELAALKSGNTPGLRNHWFTGAPSRLRVERATPGTLSEELVERIVSQLRERFGDVGRLDRAGRSMAWSLDGSGRVVRVVAEERNGEVHLRIEEPLSGRAGGLFGGILGGVGGGTMWMVIAAASRFGQLMVPLAGAIWLLTLYFIVRSAFARMAGKRMRELTQVGNRLVSQVKEEQKRTARKHPHVRVGEDGFAPNETEAEAEHQENGDPLGTLQKARRQ